MPSEARARRSSRRPARPPVEQIEIRTADGWSLRAEVREPAAQAAGVAVLAHAMMARRTEFDRGVSQMLVERGWRVVAFDFRGHGDSGPRAGQCAGWGYDDYVARDLPAVCEFAREQAGRRLPVVLVGHSLGGHVALAAQGAGRIGVDAIAAVAANVWLRELEPLPARWLVKRAALAGVLAVCRRVGRFPARALRMGSDDEPRAYFEDFARFARTGAWASADGRADYLAALERVRVPVLQLVSEGDRLECVPECGERFVARCRGPRELLRLANDDAGGPAPSHMALVTGGRTRGAWARVEAWMRSAAVAT
jgi:predicted alpha/beta hydrolase